MGLMAGIVRDLHCPPDIILTDNSWWFQGLVFTGIWVIGHEVRLSRFRCIVSTTFNVCVTQCGHGAFSANRYVCDLIGFVRVVAFSCLRKD